MFLASLHCTTIAFMVVRIKSEVPEIFSIDTEVACDNCGFVAYNDSLSCVQWCKYARKCVGDEMYEHMMQIARVQKEKKEEIA